ncbi:craniofacial development protein 2-like [Manduca sexta]|uniref:craniofacial development protein 2-like n=1 Tax=Manduca sexta TaxID=7130 RepID=UPI00188EE46A|nr:craniofacial development protein 2-like [Manduca sexta]
MRSDAELKVGQFGHGQRNLKGQRLADFLEKQGLFAMNSFFQKPPHRKWTWLSPDGSTRNEIDCILSTNRRMFSDVSVINRVKTGSDHRMPNVDLWRCSLPMTPKHIGGSIDGSGSPCDTMSLLTIL